MKKTTITVGSVTYSVKLARLLKRARVPYRLVKIDNGDNNLGCTHGVEIDEQDLLFAIVIMKENGIIYSILGDKR